MHFKSPSPGDSLPSPRLPGPGVRVAHAAVLEEVVPAAQRERPQAPLQQLRDHVVHVAGRVEVVVVEVHAEPIKVDEMTSIDIERDIYIYTWLYLEV